MDETEWKKMEQSMAWHGSGHLGEGEAFGVAEE
jgi:hypothetical protein